MKWFLAMLLGVGIVQFGAGAYIHAKAWLAQELLVAAWEKSLAGQQHVKPWPWADTWPVARLRMPERGVDLIVLSGITGRTLAFGPGHMQGSALPGQRGNSVLGGHRDTHFEFLRDVVVNDRFSVETAGGESGWYQVVDAGAEDSRASSIRLDTDAAMLTLVTCFPFDAVDPGGPMRYVVTAQKIEGYKARRKPRKTLFSSTVSSVRPLTLK
ncbi:MAG: class GN sortase [Gammaproteobacteria bacterium]